MQVDLPLGFRHKVKENDNSETHEYSNSVFLERSSNFPAKLFWDMLLQGTKLCR